MDGTEATATRVSADSATERGAHRTGVIISGAASKGPYAAGALAALAKDPRFDLRCLVGASSGALNAAVFAAGLRVGAAQQAAELLCSLWRERATWKGIITHRRRVEIMASALSEFQGKTKVRDVALSVVVTSLQGRHDPKFGYRRYERAFEFGNDDFASDAGVARIAESCVLSATIPGVFPPRWFEGEQFWDGGLVNNTPIKLALKRDRLVDHLIIITPDAATIGTSPFHRLSLSRLMDILIEERLARDLCEAKSFNEELSAMRRAGVNLESLGLAWRVLQFVELRPKTDLVGGLLQGFFSRRARDDYVRVGRETALRQLQEWSAVSYDT
jgi:predicted acylesterase/phospholipase RssA